MLPKKDSIVAGILTFSRPEFLDRTLASLNLHCSKREISRLIVFDNGSEKKCLKQNRAIAKRYKARFHCLEYENSVSEDLLARENNIQSGFKKLFEILTMEDSNTFLILEDDWECLVPVPWPILTNFLNQNPTIGQIRLRNCPYDGSPTGYSLKNFITRAHINWNKEFDFSEIKIKTGNLHWTNNPSLISRKALEIVKKISSSELDCMKEFNQHFFINAQIFPGVFQHFGPVRNRPDLKEKGLI